MRLYSFMASLGLVVVACPSMAQIAPGKPAPVGITLPVSRPFLTTETDASKPRGISGMACLAAAANGTRQCFALNDEERFGEVAVLSADALVPTGQTILYVGDADTGAGIVGTERIAGCVDKSGQQRAGKYREFDGEGAAVAGEYLYATGSHSCSGKGRYKPSSYILTRVRLASETSFLGATAPVIERSWRLADALLASDVGNAYGGKKNSGTNIEGLAVLGERLYAGLRTPTRGAYTYIVSAPVSALFAAGQGKLDPSLVATLPVALGFQTGIRDLAALKDGRLLILSGPTQSQPEIGYKIWIVAPQTKGSPAVALATLEPRMDRKFGLGKAETLVVLSETATALTLLVLYDNIDDGAPTRLEIALP